MPKILFVSFVSLCLLMSCVLFSKQKQESRANSHTELEFIPPTVYASGPYSKFFTTEIRVVNKGDYPLDINRITPSCYCADAKLLQAIINPHDTGRAFLSVNMKGMGGGDMVEFMFYSNAKDSPHSLKIRFPDISDSLRTNDNNEK